MLMVLRRLISTPQESKWNKIFCVLGVSFLAFLLISTGVTACKKAKEEAPLEEQKEKNVISFEGTVKAAEGKYIYVPSVQGFDIVVQGELSSGEKLSTLEGKEIRGEGEFSPDRPSILLANALEVKNENGEWSTVYTRGEREFVLEDYIGLSERKKFPPLENLEYDKKRTWEGKERGKVFGKLEKSTQKEGEEERISYTILVLNEEEKEVGKILVDNFTDYGLYYVKKLGIFNKLWFYLEIKDTVDWSTRRRTKEMFHAECVFAGLY